MKLALILILCLVLAACQAEEPANDVEKAEDADNVVRTEFPTTGGGVVKMVKMPEEPLQSGGVYDFSWSATGGEYVAATNVQVSSNKAFSDFAESATLTNGPGVYRGNIQIQGEGNIYVRAYAKIDGKEYYSDVLTYGFMEPST